MQGILASPSQPQIPQESQAKQSVESTIADLIIKKVGSTWVLFSKKTDSKTGKRRRLGTFRSRAAAIRRERQVQSFKHRGG